MLCRLLRALQFNPPKHSRSSAASMRHFKPALEPLEERQLLTVFNQWNFENEALGDWTEAEMAQSFTMTRYDGYNDAEIVNDTINGSTTKVVKMLHEADDLVNGGFSACIDLGVDRPELYFSYDWKFDQEFCSTMGGKLPGLYGLGEVYANTYPDYTEGFIAKMMYKRAGTLISYHWDRTSAPRYPTNEIPTTEDDMINDVYMANGNWYNVTQRVVMSTMTNGENGSYGEANNDGISEIWIDGRMVFQETNLKLAGDQFTWQSGKWTTMQIDGFGFVNFYGGSETNYAPTRDTYGYIDNMVVYLPDDDPTVGTRTLHDPQATLATLNPIEGRRVVHDTLVTNEGTLKNSSYPSNYTACLDETYLIDAGAGNKVVFSITAGTIGSGDYLLVYDGDQTDSPMLGTPILGYDSSITGTYTSTGRYMFVRLSTDRPDHAPGFTGSLDFQVAASTPTAPSQLTAVPASTTAATLKWYDLSTNETGFEIDRATNSSFSSGLTTFSVASHASTGTMSAQSTGLTAGTTYYYRVRSTNGSGDSVNSYFTSTATVPTAPSSLTATAVAMNQINLTWTDNSGASETAFLIDRATNNSFTGASLTTFSVGSNVTNFQSKGLSQNTTYYYRVRSTIGSIESAYTSTANATTAAGYTATFTSVAAEDGFVPESNETSGVGTTPNSTNVNDGIQVGDTSTKQQLKSILSFDTSSLPEGATIVSATLRLKHSTPSGYYKTIRDTLDWDSDGDTTEVIRTEGSISAQTWGGDLLVDIKGGTGFGGATALASGDFSAAADATSVAQLWGEFDSTGLWSVASLTSGLTYVNTAGKTQFRLYFEVDDSNDSTPNYLAMGSGNAAAGSQPELIVEYTTGAAAPNAPTSLGATTVSTSQINLAWTDNSSNETAFEIDRATNSDFSAGLTTTTVNSNVTTYQSTGLTEGTAYYYRVRSTIGGTNDSANSNTANTSAMPSTPTGLGATTISSSQINLAWTDVSGHETGYEIDRATNSSFSANLSSFTAAAGATSFQSTGLTASTQYFYRVRATSSGVDSANSSSANATTQAGGGSSMTFYSDAADDGYVYETNETAGTGSGYYSNVGDGGIRGGDRSTDAQVKSIVSFDTSALPDDATITSATLRLRRTGVTGTNPFAWAGAPELRVDIESPVGFAGVQALNSSDFQYTCDATNVAQMSNPASDGDWSTGSISGTGMSFINLVSGRTQFRIYFTTDDNDNATEDFLGFGSGDSATGYKPELVVEYTTGATPPAAPSGLGATTVSTSQINLSWTDNSGNETGFEIDRALDAGFTTGTSMATVASNVTTYQSTGLTEGTTYYYRVRSTNADGDSSNSNSANTTAMPSTPTGLGATAISSSQINLAWTDVSGHETAYEIDRATNSSFSANLSSFTAAAGATSFQSTGLTASTQYFYRVRATSSGVDSANSSSANATTQGGGSSMTFYSDAADDGYVYETNETAGTGSGYYSNVGDGGIRGGDRATDAQVKSIVSFDTSALPDNATITSATLRLRRTGVTGTNPFAWAAAPELRVDIESPVGFAGIQALNSSDFQYTCDATNVAQMSNPASDGDWSTASISSTGMSFINLVSGRTQFRLYFTTDDNDNATEDFLGFGSGDSADGYKPELVITYTVPMRAAQGEVTGREVEALTQETLDPVLGMAMARWEAVMRGTGRVATVWGNYVENVFANVEVVITNLPGDMLGSASGSTIYLDTDAAGYGWYADRLFANNLNFREKEGVGMDLLTVVSHELGHVLGLADAKRGVMDGTLEEGVRELPTRADLRGLSPLHGRALAAAIQSLLDGEQDESDELLLRA